VSLLLTPYESSMAMVVAAREADGDKVVLPAEWAQSRRGLWSWE
jgi:hypothetical protein